MREWLARHLAALSATESPYRAVLVVVLTCLACAALLTSYSRVPEVPWAEGEVADRDIVAPATFSYVNEHETRQRQAAAVAQVTPVFAADLTLAKRLENRVSQAFDMARRRHLASLQATNPTHAPGAEVVAQIRTDFAKALELPIDAQDLDAIVADGFSTELEEMAIELIGVGMRRNVVQDKSVLPNPPRSVTVVNLLGETRDETTLDDFDLIRSPDEARQAISLNVVERYSGPRAPQTVQAAAAIARAAVRPNFTYDQLATEQRRAAARDAVAAVEQKVRKGTRLVRAGDVVTAQQLGQVHSLHETDRSAGGWTVFAAWFGLVGVLVGATVSFSRGTIRKFARRTREREALAVALVLVLFIGRLVSSSAAVIELPNTYDLRALGLLVPVAGGAMLIRILVNSESALIWALVASVLCAVMTDRSAMLAGYYLVTALVATQGVGQARERLAVLRAGALSGLVGAALITLVAFLRSHDPSADTALLDEGELLAAAITALLGGVFNAVLALGMVPAFELFGFVTDYKLLELASLNHPLLRQLMLRAPGTYHHSVIVGSLSEAACETIGANALLARVACYFHDVGKGLKPQYFIENQRDSQNRHDRLSPEHSAAVIINHVREGGVLARQYNLPRPIVDNVYMHHGTGLIQYFYTRAKELAAPGEEVDDRIFRYPGPKPDSRESGIIMLADKVEAACRTIREPSEDRIRAMIQQIINGVMNDGQLENCPLTLKELYQIADTFTTVLLGIHHHRIEYPGTKDISSGKARFVPVPRQGTITLEILNPLTASQPGSSRPVAVPDDS